MPGTPVLHFSGRFHFDMPEYNNIAKHEKVGFDPARPREQVIALCGCNPSRYFEFRFEDVRVKQVTYRDGSADCAGDPVVDQPMHLKGFLVDVSPSSINARLFAGRLLVGNALEGQLDRADQSIALPNIRPLGSSDETKAAHYETRVAAQVRAAPTGSQYFEELGEPTELEIFFQLNRYTREGDPHAPESEYLTGDVYGYLRPRPEAIDPTGLRVVNRRLLTHPKIGSELAEFVFCPFPKLIDVEGTYDLLRDEGLLALRYLDFIPFLDRNRRTPDVERYQVSLQDETRRVRVDIGSFRGDVKDMRENGGLVHLPLPPAAGPDGFRLVVEAVKSGHDPLPLVRESDWDLELLPPPASKYNTRLTPRGVVLASGGSTDVQVKALHQNRPAEGRTVRWNKPATDSRSPLVDAFAAVTGTTGADGIATVRIEARDLRTGAPLQPAFTAEEPTNFPLDGFYGDRVVAEIDNPDRILSGGVEQVKIAVRVLHEFRSEEMPAVLSFDRDIRPLFSYHTRYFPWLHVRDNGASFARFLDLDNYADFRAHIGEILRRLELDVNDPDKMPRSRDLPFGGVDLIRKWKDTGMAP